MKTYYAGHNGYGTNVSYRSMGWWVKRFDTKKARDKWVDDNLVNEQGNTVAEPITRKTAQIILGAGEWVEFQDWLINKKNDPRN